MEKHEGAHRATKTRREFDWKGLGIQVGSAAVQGMAFALGGVAIQRLTKGYQKPQSMTSGEVIPLRQNG